MLTIEEAELDVKAYEHDLIYITRQGQGRELRAIIDWAPSSVQLTCFSEEEQKLLKQKLDSGELS